MRSPEQEKVRKQTKINNYWVHKPEGTANRFEQLEEKNIGQDQTTHRKKISEIRKNLRLEQYIT